MPESDEAKCLSSILCRLDVSLRKRRVSQRRLAPHVKKIKKDTKKPMARLLSTKVPRETGSSLQ